MGRIRQSALQRNLTGFAAYLFQITPLTEQIKHFHSRYGKEGDLSLMKNSYRRRTRFSTTLLAMAGLLIPLTLGVPASPTVNAKRVSSGLRTEKPADDATAKMRIGEAYGKLPMSFEPNRGQTDGRVKFLSRGSGYTLLLTPTEAMLALWNEKPKEERFPSSRKNPQTANRNQESSMLRMKLIGANPRPKVEGLNQLQGKTNYLIGNDRAKWHTNIPTFAQVQYAGVYPGIDVVYYGQQRQLEYDFRLAPGADPDKIRIAFEGAYKLKIDAEGNLVLKTSGGEIIQHSPVIYQENETGRQSIDGCYVLRGEREVGFEISAYDRSKPLVIDPQLVYSTYYGGSRDELGKGIAVDRSNAYITGHTISPDLLLKNSFQNTLINTTGFVMKLNSAGTDFIYSTYIGAPSSGNFVSSNAIAVTSDGKACITGMTANVKNDSDFPTKNAFQGNGTLLNCPYGTGCRNDDAFVTVFAADGSSLVYSTFFAGSVNVFAFDRGNDEGLAIAVDSSNKVYITGDTNSNDLPHKNEFQSDRAGGSLSTAPDAFIAKFDPAQSGNGSLLYSSYLGGTGTDIGRGVAVDNLGNAYIVGNTFSTDLAIHAPDSPGPIQTTNHGGSDAFVAKIDTNSSGSTSLVYLTYFGGAGTDRALAVAVDSSQRAYVTGSTDSAAATFPTKHAFQPNNAGGTDAFVVKFNANGSALFYSTFLGSAQDDEGRGIASDSAGNAYITGRTSGTGFPTVNGLPSSIDSGNTFITKIQPSDATGTTTPNILYSDTFGGGDTEGNAIALDIRGNVYITGSAGANLQTTPGAFQALNKGGTDAFVGKIESTFPDTIGVFRPSTGQFLLRNSNTTGNPDITLSFGQSGDKPLVGDWNGDGMTDIGVFRNGIFVLATVQTVLKSPCLLCVPVLTTTVTTLPQFSFGPSGGLPVAGDWNGDGIDTIGVFSNGSFQLRNSNAAGNPDLTVTFGAAGDLPVVGDWNGDGIDTVGVYRNTPQFGSFLLRNSNSAGLPDATLQLGLFVSDLPLIGDWNGDGSDNAGVFRGSATTFFLNDNNVNLDNFNFISSFTAAGDIPVAGDWNGRPDPFNAPNSGINDPSLGSSGVGQTQTFTTTCSDPDGWHDIATIDFKIAKSDAQGNGVPIPLWVQFNENANLIRFYDSDSQTWQQGEPGTNVVLSSRFADLHLAQTSVLGSGPTGSSVQITWSIVFKDAAIMNNYKQYLKITDDGGLTTGFDKVGSWSVIR